MRLNILFLFFVLAFNFAWAQDKVPAKWEARFLRFPSYMGQNCIYVNEAVKAILVPIKARNIDVRCTSHNGIEVLYESLFPSLDDDSAEEAIWRPKQLTYYRQGRGCDLLAGNIREILKNISVRKISSSVFCDVNMGQINYQFEVLVL